ncbi:MAG: hypothetical protein Q9174_002607 [Haloplaca sp. 1 TL-2023]
MPSATNTIDLPKSSSPTLRLVQATDAEVLECSTLGSTIWKGPLDLEAYLRREAHLRNTDLARDGGITYWVLVDTELPQAREGPRRILSSCETIRKRGLVARSGGNVKEVISHGIGSVFCDPRYRSKGYAQRMMVELAQILDTWQQKEGDHADFSVLWSDIGKDFYAKRGWKVYPSSHIDLTPKPAQGDSHKLPEPSILLQGDIKELCSTDEAWLRASMATASSWSSGMCVAVLPDAATMQWHHAREEFLAQELNLRPPYHKGALATSSDGRRTWCIWTRTFNQNVLHILRLAVEGESPFSRGLATTSSSEDRSETDHDMELAIAAILSLAQREASAWRMTSVELWNPSPLTVRAAKLIDNSAKVIDRDDESLTSLRWHGQNHSEGTEIEWIANEKYAWC